MIDRRGFLGAITAALFGIAAGLGRDHSSESSRFGGADGDLMFGVDFAMPDVDVSLERFKDSYLTPAMVCLKDRLSDVDIAKYHFLPLELPSSAKSWIEEVNGVPFRHIEAYRMPDEYQEGGMVHRIDVLLRKNA